LPFHCNDPNRAAIYGARARIGYTCPPLLAEVFPYEFYQVVPAGVTLVITTLAVIERGQRELDVSVMTASQACIWDVLRLTGIHDRISGYGRLLREF
jgi:hypothetical protein